MSFLDAHHAAVRKDPQEKSITLNFDGARRRETFLKEPSAFSGVQASFLSSPLRKIQELRRRHEAKKLQFAHRKDTANNLHPVNSMVSQEVLKRSPAHF